MASTNFNNGTVIQAPWLNDTNTIVYVTVPSIQTDITSIHSDISTLNTNLTNGLAGKADYSAKGVTKVSYGTSADRPALTGTESGIRYNTTILSFEGWNGTSWGSIGGGATGGVGNAAFYENDKTITVSYTITTGKNAMTAGPITINDGVVVTVPDGSVWSIV